MRSSGPWKMVFGVVAAGTVAFSGGYGFGSAGRPAVPPVRAALHEEEDSTADLLAIHSVLLKFHRATTIQGLDLLMSLWTDGATLKFQGDTYTGKRAIRDWFAYESGIFAPEHHWVALTPLPRIRVDLAGDQATVAFEAHYADAVTTVMKFQMAAQASLIRSRGTWLIQEMRAWGTSLLP